MKAQRAREAADAKERAAVPAATAAAADGFVAAKAHPSPEGQSPPAPAAAAPPPADAAPLRSKAPIQPPPSPSPQSPRTANTGTGTNTTPAPSTLRRPTPASNPNPSGQARGSTAPPPPPQSVSPPPRQAKGQYQIHPHVAPPPWARAAAPATAPPHSSQVDQEEEEEEKQQAQQPPAPAQQRESNGAMRPRPPPSRAANALARQRIMSNLAIGRAPTASISNCAPAARPATAGFAVAPHAAAAAAAATRPSTAAAALAAAGNDRWSAADRMEESALESQRIVHRAQQLLRQFSAESAPDPVRSGPGAAAPGSVPFDPLPPRPNATVPSSVPRCYPRGSVLAPRVSTARFRRAKLSDSGAAAAASRAGDGGAQTGSWDVSAELRYGHAVIEGLKARSQSLTSRLDDRAATPLPPSSAPGSASARASAGPQHASSIHAAQHADLYESLRIASSLESYYSLLSQLDLSVQRQRAHGDRGMLHHVLVGSGVARSWGRGGTAGPATRDGPPPRPHSSHSARPAASAYAGPPLSAHQALRAQAQAVAGESAWLHCNSVLPVAALARPLSGARVHPAAPPSHIPPYDSLADPHAAATLSAGRAAIIASNRREELRERPELAALLDGRRAALARERERDAAERERERRRKLRRHRPEAERISQRPRSAAVLGPESPARSRADHSAPDPLLFAFAPRPDSEAGVRAPAGASSTFRLASSAYGNGRARGSRMKASPYPNAPGARQLQLQRRPPGRRDGGGWMGTDDPRDAHSDRGGPADHHEQLDQSEPHGAGSDLDAEGLASGGLVDWWDVSSAAWPAEPSQLTRDLVSLGITASLPAAEGDEGTARTHQQAGTESPAQLLEDFFLAERCLQELHAQLGLPFLSASAAAHNEQDNEGCTVPSDADITQSHPQPQEFSLSNPPSRAQVDALLAAVRSRLACRDLVVRVVQSIAARERVVGALNDAGRGSGGADAASDALVADLRAADADLLRLLDDYDRTFRATFPARPEFATESDGADDDTRTEDADGDDRPAPLPFLFRGEEYGTKVEREKEQLEQTLAGGECDDDDDDGVRPSADDVPMETLAASHLLARAATPSQLASAAAAIVLGSIAQQARHKQAAARAHTAR